MYRIYIDNEPLKTIYTDSGHLKTLPYKSLNEAVAEMTYRLTKAFNENSERKTMLTFQIVKDR
jgi:hypothetical protein